MDYWTLLFGIAVLLAFAYAAAHLSLTLRWQPPRSPWLLLLVTGLGVRVLFLLLFPNPGTGDVSFDAESYRIVADLVLSGNDVYAETDRYPYLPFHMYWFALSALLEDSVGGSFFFWVRWPHILADLGILLIIYRGSLKLGRSESMAFSLALLWALQPISIYQSILHGQFHSVAIFFALLSWYVLMFRPGWRGALGGGLAMGFAVLDHSWPIILVPVFILIAPSLKGRMAFLLGVAVVPLVFVAAYFAAIGTTLDLLQLRVLEHDPTPFRFGYSYFLYNPLYGIAPREVLTFAGSHSREIMFGALAIVSAVMIARRDAMTAATAVIATIYVASYSLGNQQLLWIIPFALMAGQIRMLALYSGVLSIGLLIYYWGTCGLVCPGYLTSFTEFWSIQWVWPVAIIWLAREVILAVRVQGPNLANEQRPSDNGRTPEAQTPPPAVVVGV